MPLTRAQKEEEIKIVRDSIKSGDGFILVGFSKMSVSDLRKIRKSVRENGGGMRVVRKRLLRLALANEKIDSYEFEESSKNFLGQTGFISFRGDVSNVAGAVYNLAKEKGFKFFGGYNSVKKEIIPADYLTRISHLPPREVLLASVVSTMLAPLRAFMYVLKARSKQSS